MRNLRNFYWQGGYAKDTLKLVYNQKGEKVCGRCGIKPTRFSKKGNTCFITNEVNCCQNYSKKFEEWREELNKIMNSNGWINNEKVLTDGVLLC